jgi:hypothetical protein
MNNELERISKKAVVVEFNVPSRHLPGGTVGYLQEPVRTAGLLAEI